MIRSLSFFSMSPQAFCEDLEKATFADVFYVLYLERIFHALMNIAGTRTLTAGKLTWLDVHNPDLKVLQSLAKKYDFHELDIEDCLSEHQRSKVDEYDDYLFIILHVPFYDKRTQKVLYEEVDFFVKNNLVITVHWGGVKALTDFFEEVHAKPTLKAEVLRHSSGFVLYEIISHLYSSAFPILDVLDRNLAGLEKAVFGLNQSQDMLREILKMKKNIITFRRVIGPQRQVVALIEHKNKKFLPTSLEIYFDDVVDKIEKIWSNLENLKELTESLQETNESIISHTTNNVIKTLTIFSVIMLPLTFVTSLYGMNIILPLSTHPGAFGLLLGAMLLIVALMLGFFRYKRWI
jgi:magnesium transporter